MEQKIDLNGKTILVTGSPGFIGAILVLRLLATLKGGTVVSLDNLNPYYDVKLKEYRLSQIEVAAKTSPVRHTFIQGDISDKILVDTLFADYHFDIVVNLAAQAGVRYSITNPDAYIQSNLIGFYNILEACRHSYLKTEYLGHPWRWLWCIGLFIAIEAIQWTTGIGLAELDDVVSNGIGAMTGAGIAWAMRSFKEERQVKPDDVPICRQTGADESDTAGR